MRDLRFEASLLIAPPASESLLIELESGLLPCSFYLSTNVFAGLS
jgi:hypothetical protein